MLEVLFSEERKHIEILNQVYLVGKPLLMFGISLNYLRTLKPIQTFIVYLNISFPSKFNGLEKNHCIVSSSLTLSK